MHDNLYRRYLNLLFQCLGFPLIEGAEREKKRRGVFRGVLLEPRRHVAHGILRSFRAHSLGRHDAALLSDLLDCIRFVKKWGIHSNHQNYIGFILFKGLRNLG